ncbi:MAG: hypothetical protein ACYC5M_10875 [Anaerolineae bacterium]
MYKGTTLWAVALLMASLLIALPAFAHSTPSALSVSAVALQEEAPTPDPDEDETPTSSQHLVRLIAQLTGLDPEAVLAAMVEYDAGLGAMVIAARLAEAYEGAPGMSFEELLAAHQSEEGIGWGVQKSALRWAGGDPELAAEILARHTAGEGWGQIKKSLTPTGEITSTVELDPEGQLLEAPKGPKTMPPGLAKKLDSAPRRGGRK